MPGQGHTVTGTPEAAAEEPAISRPEPEKPVTQEPVMSLYDLFGFTQEERRLSAPGGSPSGRRSRLPRSSPCSTSWNRSAGSPYPKIRQPKRIRLPKPSPVGRRTPGAGTPPCGGRGRRQERMKPRPFTGERLEHYRNGSLVGMDGQTGYLSGMEKGIPVFHPLELPAPPAAACRILYGTP